MNLSKVALSCVATAALAFAGVAQAETIRAGASLPVAKVAKLSRKKAKKGVELYQAPVGGGVPGGGAVAGGIIAGGLAVGGTLIATGAVGGSDPVTPITPGG
jgi:hypothetical protein